MEIISMLIAVDGAALAQQVADGSLSPGSPDAPTSLGDYSDSGVYIIMMASFGPIIDNTRKQPELRLAVSGADTTRWAISTLDNNHDQTAYLYRGRLIRMCSVLCCIRAKKRRLTWLRVIRRPAPLQNLLIRLIQFWGLWNYL